MWAKLNINSDICKFSDKILTIIILLRWKRKLKPAKLFHKRSAGLSFQQIFFPIT